jgi:simple sugar transport system permease protein
VLTKGAAVVGFPMQYSEIGNGSVGGIGIPLIVFLFFLFLFLLIQKKAVLGINLYLVGTNAKAAAFSGIRTARTLILSYMLSGALASIAGIIMTARTNAAKADYGASYILQSILVAVLGGTNPSGGSGNVVGILMAVLSLQFLSSGFNMLRFSNFAKEFIWGVFLLAIMIVNYYTNERHKT